jgi:hypothetical protein
MHADVITTTLRGTLYVACRCTLGMAGNNSLRKKKCTILSVVVGTEMWSLGSHEVMDTHSCVRLSFDLISQSALGDFTSQL